MASAFDAMFDAAFTAAAIAAFAEDITYTPATGSPRTISAVVQRETRGPDLDEVGRNFYNTMLIDIPARESDGVLDPSELRNGADGDKFTIDGQVWLLQRIMNAKGNATVGGAGGWHQLKLFDMGVKQT